MSEDLTLTQSQAGHFYTDETSGALRARRYRVQVVAGPDVGRSLTEAAQDTLRHIDRILDQNAKPLNSAITGIAAFAEMLGRNSQRVEGLIGGLENLAGTGTPKQGPTVYDLAAASTFPKFEKAIQRQVVVPDPNALIV